MSNKVILSISLKVMGVYYALSALNMLPSAITQIVLFWDAWKPTTQNDPLNNMLTFRMAAFAGILIPVLLFLFASLIVFKSDRISNFLLRKERYLNNNFSSDFSNTVLNYSIKIFGFFSLLSSIRYISELLSKYLVMKDNLTFYDSPSKINLASSGISAALYICVGLILVFYSRAVADKLLKFDSKIKKEDDTSET